MIKRILKNPYAWAGVAVFAVVLSAWFTRDAYQPVGPGYPAPDFAAVNLQGDTVRLADYRGQVVLLNIWATWCPPCVEEMPSMERLHNKIEDPDFSVVAVSVDAREGQINETGKMGGDVAEFVEEFGITFDVLHNPSGSIMRTFGATAVPESFIIGRDGVIYQRVTGPSEWDSPSNTAMIERLLERGATSP